MVQPTLIAFLVILPSAQGLICLCNSTLSALDDKMKQQIPTLRTPVCVDGKCDITASVPTGAKALCTYFDSSMAMFKGYYCTAGLSTDPSTMYVEELGNLEVRLTHCETDRCNPQPAKAAAAAKTTAPTGTKDATAGVQTVIKENTGGGSTGGTGAGSAVKAGFFTIGITAIISIF